MVNCICYFFTITPSDHFLNSNFSRNETLRCTDHVYTCTDLDKELSKDTIVGVTNTAFFEQIEFDKGITGSRRRTRTPVTHSTGFDISLIASSIIV